MRIKSHGERKINSSSLIAVFKRLLMSEPKMQFIDVKQETAQICENLMLNNKLLSCCLLLNNKLQHKIICNIIKCRYHLNSLFISIPYNKIKKYFLLIV